MTLKLYDTYERKLREFVPLEPGRVGLYTCGPTVYDYAHIGNLRTYIFEDFLRRVLEFNGYVVNQVMNITDVGHLVSDSDTGEDKMEKGSRRTGKTAEEIAEQYTQAFRNDLARLNIIDPTIWCRATDHIQEQIDFVSCIEKKGYTYQTSDGIYFDTTKLSDYGTLGRLDIDGLRAGSRIDMGEKKNVTDFALWKFSPKDKQRQMEWDSPWGVGFPGWHIECSAMSAKYLGEFFDIHCGGEDHINVHHTNEIAQTEACYGTRLANFWMHGYFLQLDTERMSKSSGEFLRLDTLVEKGYDPLAYRYFCLNANYRSKLTFTWDGLDSASTSLERLRQSVYSWGVPGNVDEDFMDKFAAQINEDLNMPRAIAVAWDLVRSDLPDASKKATILEFDRVLGLQFADWAPKSTDIPADIQALVDKRQAARTSKDWALADELREQINELGYEVEDRPDGPRLIQKKG